MNAIAQPSSALSSTGISTSMPAHALGRGRGGLQGRVRAQRRAADHGLFHLEVVEQRDRLAPKACIE